MTVPAKDLNSVQTKIKVPLDEWAKTVAKEAAIEALREFQTEFPKTCPLNKKIDANTMRYWVLIALLIGNAGINCFTIFKFVV